MGHNDLGDFHSARGDFAMALKCYVRTRDYCTTSKHIITMCLNIIRVSIHMGNFSHVANYITKAESTDSSGSDPVLMAQLRVSAGLGQLEVKKYKLAARKLLETNPELGSSFHEIVSPQARPAPYLCTALRLCTPPAACPVAPAPRPPCERAPLCTASAPPRAPPRLSPAGRGDLRCALCARLLRPRRAQSQGHRQHQLPLLPRARARGASPHPLHTPSAPPPLHSHCTPSAPRPAPSARTPSSHSAALPLRAPLQVREIVHDFYNSRYASCLKTLERLKPDLLLDLHLHDHVATLYTDIRSKALVQYFSPFVAQHAHTPPPPPPPPPTLPLVAPRLLSLLRATTRRGTPRGKGRPKLRAQPLPRVLEPAASKAAESGAFWPCR
jgi:hypothetical protein